MKLFGRKILPFLAFVVLILASIYGVLLPNNPQVSAVGAMQIAPYSDGLSLFQDYRRLYYRFSPFNDYTVDAQNNRSSFISIPEIENRDYEVNLEQSKFINILRTANSYLTGGSPTVTFNTDQLSAKYTAEIEGHKATIHQQTVFSDPQESRRIGMTLSYNGDDIVFDNSLNAYNYWDQNDLDAFARTYARTLNPNTSRLLVPIPDRTLYITNPHAPFVIVIKSKPNQILRVNRDAKLIEIEELTNPGSTHSTSITVETYSSLEEVL